MYITFAWISLASNTKLWNQCRLCASHWNENRIWRRWLGTHSAESKLKLIEPLKVIRRATFASSHGTDRRLYAEGVCVCVPLIISSWKVAVARGIVFTRAAAAPPLIAFIEHQRDKKRVALNGNKLSMGQRISANTWLLPINMETKRCAWVWDEPGRAVAYGFGSLFIYIVCAVA